MTVVADGNRDLKTAAVQLREIDPDRTYTVGTIDYLAWGNDDLTPLANGRWIFSDDVELCAPVIRYVTQLTRMGIPLDASPNSRFIYN